MAHANTSNKDVDRLDVATPRRVGATTGTAATRDPGLPGEPDWYQSGSNGRLGQRLP